MHISTIYKKHLVVLSVLAVPHINLEIVVYRKIGSESLKINISLALHVRDQSYNKNYDYM
jgi:hypothetical protein